MINYFLKKTLLNSLLIETLPFIPNESEYSWCVAKSLDKYFHKGHIILHLVLFRGDNLLQSLILER